jgi:alanine dehydrogenase
MKICFMKERNENEKRAIITPQNLRTIIEYFQNQISLEVLVEKGIGEFCDYGDNEYKNAGAIIVNNEEAWNSNIIIKYKAPNKDEIKKIKSNQTLIALTHLEGNFELLKHCMKNNNTIYSFEYYNPDYENFSLATVGGEISGYMAAIYSIYFSQNVFGGSGKLPISVRGSRKTKIGVIGYGNVGQAAIKILYELGNEVYVIGRKKYRMEKKYRNFSEERLKIIESTPTNISKIIPEMDVLIGTILISSYDTPELISDKIISKMKKGSVIIDVTCGYGRGYLPFLEKSTDLKKPYYIKDGKVCIKIDNLPAAYHKTTTEAYSYNIVSYIKNVIECIYFDQKNETRTSLLIQKGEIVNSEILKHYEYYEKG